MAFNILVVDDSPAMRRVLKRVLELSGVEVGNLMEASGGREALAVLHSEWVDLIMTDINMPEMDGEQLLTEVMQDSSLSSIPVLVISTDRTELRMKRMMDIGASGYVCKPFSPAMLSDQIGRLLGGSPDASF